MKRVELNTNIVSTAFNTQTLKMILILYKYVCCNKDYKKSLKKSSKKTFTNTWKFSDRKVNKFISLLPKGIYP